MNGGTQITILQQLFHGLGIGRKSAVMADRNFQMLAGKRLFLSGQGSVDPDSGSMEHKGDVVAQADYIYGNIFKVIAAAGGSPENLVKTIEYVTPDALARYREVGALRTKVLAKPYPAATGLICQQLLRAEMQIEVDPFAVLD